MEISNDVGSEYGATYSIGSIRSRELHISRNYTLKSTKHYFSEPKYRYFVKLSETEKGIVLTDDDMEDLFLAWKIMQHEYATGETVEVMP